MAYNLKQYLFINHAFKLIAFGFFFLSAIQVIHAQISSENSNSSKDKKYNFYSQLKFDYGGVVGVVKEQGIHDYYGLDLRFALQKRKNDVYSSIYRAPKFGLGLYSGNFNNNDFGHPFGVYGFYEIPIILPQSKWSFVYNIGLGMGFNFNYYNPEGNPNNLLIGTERNVYISLAFESRYNITDHWVLGAGFGFKHFSNGRVKLPNKGINLIPITVMAEYNIGDTYTDIKEGNLKKFQPFNCITVFGAAGRKNFEYDEPIYFKSSLGASYLRQFNYKFRYGGGLELFYTDGSLDRIPSDKSNFNKLFSYGFVGVFEWQITERLYMPLNVGIYFNHNKENVEEIIYQRIGVRYLVGKPKKLFLGVSLKATRVHADYTEWTLGYTFKKDPNKYELLF